MSSASQDIIEFIFFPVVNEGCRVIDEGIVDKPADLDVATVMAMGFPPYRCAVGKLSHTSCSLGPVGNLRLDLLQVHGFNKAWKTSARGKAEGPVLRYNT